ncbi:MAG: preprotein translocase subunit YajC [Acetobacteraceae bacterium]|nr:preprotein translocase subunit YajC [Acetobacteraceae bacterium]
MPAPMLAQAAGSAWSTFLPLILLFALMYFLLIRPQQVQARKRREMLAQLHKGDKIITLGGIYGTITDIKDDIITLRIADKVEIQLARHGVSGLVKG